MANSILIKVNQIGTLTETPEAMAMAASRLHRHRLAPLRRNRGRHHRRHRGRDQCRPDQDRRALAHRPRAGITSCSASEALGDKRFYLGRKAFNVWRHRLGAGRQAAEPVRSILNPETGCPTTHR